MFDFETLDAIRKMEAWINDDGEDHFNSADHSWEQPKYVQNKINRENLNASIRKAEELRQKKQQIGNIVLALQQTKKK